MDIFLSYRDSAGAAEDEFRSLFEKLGDGGWFSLPSLSTDAEGWSRMLPGIVCDLSGEASGPKAPAVFMGMLGERSMLSCVLQESDPVLEELNFYRLLRDQLNNTHRISFLSSETSDRLDYLSRIVDGTVSIQEVSLDRGPSLSPPWITGITQIGLNDPSGPHFRLSDFGVSHYQTEVSALNPLDERLGNLLALLNTYSSREASQDTFRKLARDYHCRFAWASIKSDEQPVPERMSYSKLPAFIEEFPAPLLRDRENMKELKAFWEKRALVMKPLGLSPPLANFMQPNRPSWPYWLQFLVLITDAGRRRLRKYSFRKLLRLGRAGKGKRLAPCDTPPADEAPPNETIAHLFMGRSAAEIAASDILQLAPRARRKRRGGVAKRLPALRGTETVYALFVGDANLPPEPPCDADDEA